MISCDWPVGVGGDVGRRVGDHLETRVFLHQELRRPAGGVEGDGEFRFVHLYLRGFAACGFAFAWRRASANRKREFYPSDADSDTSSSFAAAAGREHGRRTR